MQRSIWAFTYYCDTSLEEEAKIVYRRLYIYVKVRGDGTIFGGMALTCGLVIVPDHVKRL